MNFNEYQEAAHKTAVYEEYIYPVLGLSAEVGELMSHYAKLYRGDFREIDRDKLIKEAGDILWELTEILTQNDITLEHIAETNIKKLKDRQDRDKLKGDGDER